MCEVVIVKSLQFLPDFLLVWLLVNCIESNYVSLTPLQKILPKIWT